MYRLTSLMLIVSVVAITGYNILFGQAATRSFSWFLMRQYTYVFVYVTVSFSSFQVIPGYIGSFKIPKRLFFPKILRYPDYTGLSIRMDRRGRKTVHADSVLNYLSGTERLLRHRVVMDGLPNCYGIEVGERIYIIQFVKEHPRQNDVWQVAVFKPKNPEHPKLIWTLIGRHGELWTLFDTFWPSRCNCFKFSIKANPFIAMHCMIAKKRIFPTTKTMKCHWNGDWNINTYHANLTVSSKVSRYFSIRSINASSVSKLMIIYKLKGFLISICS